MCSFYLPIGKDLQESLEDEVFKYIRVCVCVCMYTHLYQIIKRSRCAITYRIVGYCTCNK